MKMCDFVFSYIGNKTTQTKIPVHSSLKLQKYISEWLLTKINFLTNVFLYFVIHVSFTSLRYEHANLTKLSRHFGPGIHLVLVTYNNCSPFRCSKLQSFFFFHLIS